MLVLTVQEKTIFAKLKDVFPECEFLIRGAPQLFQLRCLVDHCPRNANCMEGLAKRVKWFFDTFKEASLVFLYFAGPDKPGSIRGGVFWRDMREPRVITFNRAAWEKFKKMGVVYETTMPDELFLGTRRGELPQSP